MARKGSGVARAPFSASSQSAATKAKRTRANRSSKSDPSNAYVFEQALPKRHRTSEQQLSLSHEEAKAGPSSPRRRQNKAKTGGDDGEEDEDDQEMEMEERIRKLQMMIAGDAPGEVDEDSEESEIDSDEAWESDGSDEERWGDVFRDLRKDKSKSIKAKGKEVVKKPAKPLNVDLNESEDEQEVVVEAVKGTAKGSKAKDSVVEAEEDAEDDDEEEIEESDGDDAEESSDTQLEELDGMDGESEDEFAVDRAKRPDGGPEEEDEDEDEGSQDDESGDEDEDEPSEAELPSDISEDEDQSDTLNGLDSFVDQLDAADQKKRQNKDVIADAAPKKRRVLPVSSGPAANGNAASGKLDLSTLIASHPSLSGASALLPGKADKKSSSSILKQGVLPAPLPTVVQDRLDREAAYEKTKEEGQKWSGAMKRIKEAEHLQFPLQAKDRGGVKSSGEVIGSFKAQNQFEDAITSLLNKANLTESEVTKREDEELQGQELTMEEVKARRDQLRYQRELMFRAEAKAKRVAKIKSKTYRKLARKRAAKDGGGEIDLEDLERLDPEAAAAEREKLERDRARERATLRHGAKSGRWARDVGGDGEIEDRRKAKEDMLDLKERLQRKISGRDEGAGSSDDDSDDGTDNEDDEDAIRAKAFDQLKALDNEPQQAGKGGKKGLMEMAFMKKAQDRDMKRVAEEEREARRDIERYGRSDDEDDESSGDEDVGALMEKVGGNEGRMVFTSTAKPPVNEIAPGVTRSSMSPEPAPLPTSPPANTQPFKSALSQPTPESNPWLAASSSAGPSRKKNAQVKSDKASRTLAKSAQAREAAMEDERVDIAVDAPVKPISNGKKRKGAAAADDDDDDDGEDEDAMLPTGLKGFKQRDLVAEAFAGDNVVQDFATEKAKQVEADAPKTEDTSLPGWGSWGGKGVKKRKTHPKFLVETAGVEPSKRKDFESSNVIITEKKDKRASQFQVKDLPYPYTSVEQYEARFRTPLGSEWNSRATHQKETMPRVTKKPGAIIEPIRRLF